jgi:adenylate cyclase class IV
MPSRNLKYEVEFRCHFDTKEEAYKRVPFLSSCLKVDRVWVDTYYGIDLFRSGEALRISDILIGGNSQHYLTWKKPDTGNFANIRQEIEENITPDIENSVIMEHFGAKKKSYMLIQVASEIERLGYAKFMTLQGHNSTGIYEPAGINMKLMNCPALKWPLMLEFEKIARNKNEAEKYESELKALYHHLKLENYQVKEEPATLLFNQLFAEG